LISALKMLKEGANNCQIDMLQHVFYYIVHGSSLYGTPLKTSGEATSKKQ